MGQVIQFPKPKTLWGRLKRWWLREQNLARRYRKQIEQEVLKYNPNEQSKK